MVSVIKSVDMTLPYGMLLTRLFEHVRVNHPYSFSNELYLVYHVMIPLSEKRVFQFTLLSSLQGMENDPLNNYTFDPIPYVNQLPPIERGESPEFKQTKWMFQVFNTRRQQVEETCHVTFDEGIEAIRFTNTLIDEIGIDDSSKYPLDEFLLEDDPSRQYQANSDISYCIISHGRSLTELIKDTHVPEVITLNEQNTPHTENVAYPPDLTNTKGKQEQEVQNEQINNQPTE
nr:retrovirus-related Pol polyprotein from transposon TNT 1-94 [Tanacetum cinerariifolium]